MALAHCSSHHPADDVPTRPSAASLLQSVIIFYLVSDFLKKVIQTGHQQVNCAFRLKIVALMIVIILCGHFFFGSHKNAVGQQSVYRKRIFQHLHYLVSCPIFQLVARKNMSTSLVLLMLSSAYLKYFVVFCLMTNHLSIFRWSSRIRPKADATSVRNSARNPR